MNVRAAISALSLLLSTGAAAQAPEMSMREFASGQIKKGVRALGFGGDGATWGNYALVYRDAGGALADFGFTGYSDGNDFTFTAVGFTSPKLWHGLALYAIALSQHASGLELPLKSPGLGAGPVNVHGGGASQAVFVKAALPLGYGFSVGGLLSYELSQFDGVPDSGPGYVHLETQWRPSGGFGVTWQPDPRVLVGTRFLLNNDWESRSDPAGTTGGLYSSYEARLGGSVSLWPDGILDAGGTVRRRLRRLDRSAATSAGPNLGIEQTLFDKHLVLRAGLDETSPTAGITGSVRPFKLDIAYVYNLGMARVGNVFGDSSSSLLFTLSYDYGSQSP